MQFTLVSWNVEGRLSRVAPASKRGSPERIVDEIERFGADVVFLPESSDGDRIEPAILERLRSLGYHIRRVTYDDKYTREIPSVDSQSSMMLLTRIPIVRFKTVRYADIRTMIIVDLQNGFRFFGVHADDRNEQYRIAQMKELAVDAQEGTMPKVLAGDWNAMHSNDWKAKLARSPLTKLLSKLLPTAPLRYALRCFSAMGAGSALAIIKSAGFHDADPAMRATVTPKQRGLPKWLPSFKMAQIDHVFLSKEVASSHFYVATDGGSDHRALVVRLTSN